MAPKLQPNLRGLKVRNPYLILILIAGLGVAGCARNDERRDDSAARQAGRDAYHAGQEVKKGAKEAADDARKAGKEFKEGWDEARRNDRGRNRQGQADRARPERREQR